MLDISWSPMMAVPAGVVGMVAAIPLVRLLRAKQLIRTRTGRCDLCGSHEALTYVFFVKNTGMLVARVTSTVEANACRRCGLREGSLVTLHTALLGWWGMISFVITALGLPLNLLQLWWLLGVRGAAATAADGLEQHRDYALNLLATKDRDTVVEVLSRQTGAAPDHVSRYLDRLAPAS